MNNLQKVVTKKVLTLPRTGIGAVDMVHDMICQYRIEGTPLGSLTLRPRLFDIYAFWVSKIAGREKVYGPDGKVAAPLECDGVMILEGEQIQKLEIIPKVLPIDDKAADRWRKYIELHGKYPEHHSQVN